MDHRVLEHYDGDITRVNIAAASAREDPRRHRWRLRERSTEQEPIMSAYHCPVCDYVYDEAKGAAREGFPAGTAWADVPDEWCCPDCGVREKVDFEAWR